MHEFVTETLLEEAETISWVEASANVLQLATSKVEQAKIGKNRSAKCGVDLLAEAMQDFIGIRLLRRRAKSILTYYAYDRL